MRIMSDASSADDAPLNTHRLRFVRALRHGAVPHPRSRLRRCCLNLCPQGEEEEEQTQSLRVAPWRTNYILEESVLLTKCWVDISEDPVFANNQRQITYWERIDVRYNEVKPAASYKRHREQLRKHCDQIKNQVNLFSVEYTKCLREQGSGKNLNDMCDKALTSYISLYDEFKHYSSWLIVKEKQKFQGRIMHISSARKRTKNTATGDYTSNYNGAIPMDLNQPMLFMEVEWNEAKNTGM
ncbi:glutathione S-transferase T3-like [Salvia splendens]|uniref:glutathione S-transferase T3-like n=1 Tax=Salvia splendens TaxID=180675 RepID=UPI001C27D71E|nr:glutathione S-transferase T3-like [Salvia splendens]